MPEWRAPSLRQQLALIQKQSEIVKDIFRMFLSGSKQRAIARQLNALRVIHPLGLDGETVKSA